MQVYGMQCIDTDGFEEHIWWVDEDGDEVEDEADGKEEKIKFMQFDMKSDYPIIFL